MYNLGLTWCIKVHTVRVEDVSEERKTAEHLKRHIKSVMAQLQTEWDVVLVAIVTDASGECRKARRELASEYPALIILDCWAHQVHIGSQ